ncbi:MAG: hypothetical protein GXO75_03270 [Calditrichaeota bacterium]|nr:hypothetical protein [Calditrichota bacterium]
MDKQFVYFYFMKNDPDKIRSVVPLHVAYWKNCRLNEYASGPFADRSGGLITFKAETIEKATESMMSDPFVSEDLIEQKWIKEWLVE